MHSQAGVSYFGCGHIIVQLDNHSTVFWGNLLHAQGNLLYAQVFYCKYPGMKLENWDAARCRTLVQISTALLYSEYSIAIK